MCLAAVAFQVPAAEIDVFDISKPEAINVEPSVVDDQGRQALRSAASAAHEGRPGGMAILKETEFGGGGIEIDLAGEAGPCADAGARGFAGAQVRRNHCVQGESLPDYRWPRLSKAEPEQYEFYADLRPGVRTPRRLVVSGTKARLSAHGAGQPARVVNGLKPGASKGRIAPWTGPGTAAQSADLRLK